MNAHEQARADALVRWAEAHGAIFSSNLRIIKGQFGFGAQLIRGIAEDEPLCTVPLDITLSTHNLHRSPYAAQLEPLDEWTRLYLLIASEKFDTERKSFWQAYLDMLPAEVDTPVMWSSEVRALLRGSNLHGECLLLRVHVTGAQQRTSCMCAD